MFTFIEKGDINMQVGVGYSDNPDTVAAGRQAAMEALSKVEREDPCDLVLLFSTAPHNQKTLREAVSCVVGGTQKIYGGGSVGIITNDNYGYAGDQVGVACMWLDDSKCNIVVEEGLLESEMDTGERLGKQLAEIGINPDTSVMMFYDAVDSTGKDLRLLMATWILDGIEKGLGFFPDLMGAGMQGDHSCSSTGQYTGDDIKSHSAFAMAFSDDIQIDSVIMHGCRPASQYYTVTKSEGSVILEINGEPAIDFIDKILGPSIKPEQYPFFLLFGINHGDDYWGEYNESEYASRLCLDIDRSSGGIVMFEPDMVPGTQFQIMFRSLDLDYMKPKLQNLFDSVEDRELVFSVYIDCAGRCAGYGGVEIEDAFVVQEATRGKVPLLGLYTGVEIGSIGGRPRGLDWTGVFCLFSKSKSGKIEKKVRNENTWNDEKNKNINVDEIPLESMINLCRQNAAKVLSLDTQSIALRHELEQKRRGFGLLAELSVSLRQGDDTMDIFESATKRINAALNMQKTAVLIPDNDNLFTPSVLQGYTPEEISIISGKHIEIDEEMLDMDNPVLITGADDENRLKDVRESLNLPYFISIPVVVQQKIVAIIITGRMVEATPFLSRLGENDLETVQAISALLASLLVHQKLNYTYRQAQSDTLTGLLNRGALEARSEELLTNSAHNFISAFIMIDLDYFKDVNDTYGHPTGDTALKTLAETLQHNFRTTDVIARLGGDEFAVFCNLRDDTQILLKKIEKLINEWRTTPIYTTEDVPFYTTLSMGISIAPHDGKTYTELLHKADIALYKSKQNGRDRFTIYDGKTMRQM